MSARVVQVHAPTAARTGVVLLGSGAVGSALLRQLVPTHRANVTLVGLANSRVQVVDAEGLDAGVALQRLAAQGSARDDAALLAALDAFAADRSVIVDATASPDVAARHAHWLGAGYDVVTANKLGVGDALASWQAVHHATVRGDSGYGDSATVGAGLPVLNTLRRLHGCGDRLLTLEGVFSGSLSWLFNHYDGTRPFSALLAEARAWGYTEPDPRSDLSGTDVARKLLILARAAGIALEAHDVEIENLVPVSLRGIGVEAFRGRAPELDAVLTPRLASAQTQGRVLRYLARFEASGRARVGLHAVDAAHPAARLSGCDNLFALTTARYRERPLLIQGAGAGPEVTAQALLGDVLALRERVAVPPLALAV